MRASAFCWTKYPLDPPGNSLGPSWRLQQLMWDFCWPHNVPSKHSTWDRRGRSAGEPHAAVCSGLQKQIINLSRWLSTEVHLPGQRLVCKAFYQFPWDTARAGRETMDFTHRKKAGSGLCWGCFMAVKLHWPPQARGNSPLRCWVWLFPTYTFFLHCVHFFLFPHLFSQQKVLQPRLWMHITRVLSFQRLTLSQTGSSTDNNCITISLGDRWHICV